MWIFNRYYFESITKPFPKLLRSSLQNHINFYQINNISDKVINYFNNSLGNEEMH